MKTNIKILSIEDNPGDILLLQEALSEMGGGTTMENKINGQEGLEYLRSLHPDKLPDLIFLDLNLPRLNGKEVLAAIKSDQMLKRIPVIVLTASSAEKDITESYVLAANCYVTKPLGLDEFLETIKSLTAFWITIAKIPPSGRT